MKRNLGNFAIIFFVLLTVIVWFVFPPEYDGRPNFERQYAGEVIGSVNIVLMSFALFLSTRPKWAEPYFGGLDKMYITHRQVATAAFLLIFVHVLTVPISVTGWKLGNYLAVIAFNSSNARKHVKLVNPQPEVDKSLETAGMKLFFKVFKDLDSALASFP